MGCCLRDRLLLSFRVSGGPRSLEFVYLNPQFGRFVFCPIERIFFFAVSRVGMKNHRSSRQVH